MICFVDGAFGQKEWTEIISGLPYTNYLQSWEYGEAKASNSPWRVERGIFTEGSRTLGAAQVMVRRIPFGCGGLAWISRGPLWQKPDMVLGLFATLRRHYVEERGFYLRVAPPAPPNEALESDCGKAGFCVTPVSGWASAVVDLSAEETVVRAGLRGNWRNHLNKAERGELTIEITTDTAAFQEFLISYRKFLALRDISTSVTPELLERLRQLLPDECKPIVCRAIHDSGTAGSILIMRHGNSCEYFAGQMDDTGRRLDAGQLMLWRAMCEMKSRGYDQFDLGGMDPERTPKGIYDFKDGVGGVPYRLTAEIEAYGKGPRERLVRWWVTRARSAVSGENVT